MEFQKDYNDNLIRAVGLVLGKSMTLARASKVFNLTQKQISKGKATYLKHRKITQREINQMNKEQRNIFLSDIIDRVISAKKHYKTITPRKSINIPRSLLSSSTKTRKKRTKTKKEKKEKKEKRQTPKGFIMYREFLNTFKSKQELKESLIKMNNGKPLEKGQYHKLLSQAYKDYKAKKPQEIKEIIKEPAKEEKK